MEVDELILASLKVLHITSSRSFEMVALLPSKHSIKQGFSSRNAIATGIWLELSYRSMVARLMSRFSDTSRRCIQSCWLVSIGSRWTVPGFAD